MERALVHIEEERMAAAQKDPNKIDTAEASPTRRVKTEESQTARRTNSNYKVVNRGTAQ